MKILLTLSALQNQFSFFMGGAYRLKSDDERRNGTPTLIATQIDNGTQDYWFKDKNYSCKCMSCGWDYTSKNTYNRLENQNIQCPNCGYGHKKENVHIISNKPETNKIPMNWLLKLKQQNKTTLVLEITYDHYYKPWNQSPADRCEKFIFDLKENKATWELWQVDNWHRGISNPNKKTTLLETLDIGYIKDKITLNKKSVFSFLLPKYEDDNKTALASVIKTLKEAILKINTQQLNKNKQNLNLNGKNEKTLLLDNILNIAHRVRFWDSPALSFLGTKENSISHWFEENQLNPTTNDKMEKAIEEDMRKNNINAYTAYLKYFNIPDNPIMRKHFTFKNIGLYKILERRYQNNNIVNILFTSLSDTPGKLTNKNYGYSYKEKKKSNIELILDTFDKHVNEIMLLSDEFIARTVEDIKQRIINISKLMPDYKEKVKYNSENINKLIVDFASLAVSENIFNENIKIQAAKERKTEIQTTAEILKVPNNSIFRKYYDYDYKEFIQKVYNKFNIKTANEFLKVFNEAKIIYNTNGSSYIPFSNWNGKYNQLKSCKQNFNQFLTNIISFYETFQPIYPNTVTPNYAAKFVQKEENFAVDSINMFNKLNEEFKQEFINNKPRMKDIHNTLMLIMNKQNYPEIEYNIPQDVINRFEMYCTNSKMKVLKKYSELLEAGNMMNNCSSSYRERITPEHLLVVYTNDLGKPLAELEINNNNIIQAKLINNVAVKTNAEINAEILKFAKKTKLTITTSDIEKEPQQNENINAA